MTKTQSSCLMLVLLLGAYSAPAPCADKSAILRHAKETYYNLKANGLGDFTCQVSPDFEAAYKDIQMDAVGRDQILPAAKKINFQVAVGPTGASAVSHQFSEAPPTEEVAQRLQKVAGGMEQIISGFFKTWSNMMINSPFSDDEYQIEESPQGYALTGNKGETQVNVGLTRDLVMTTLSVRTSAFEGTLRPQFSSHEGGLLLKSYDATYKSGNSSQDLTVKIDYQDIEGLPIPNMIEVLMVLPQGRMDAPIRFTNCKVTRK
jgi:hypothetical protein